MTLTGQSFLSVTGSAWSPLFQVAEVVSNDNQTLLSDWSSALFGSFFLLAPVSCPDLFLIPHRQITPMITRGT